MAAVGALGRAIGPGVKVTVVTAAVTGTGAIATGLTKILSAHAQVIDSSSVAPISIVTGHSIAGGTYNVVVLDVTPTGPVAAVSGSPHNVVCTAFGY
jgi:hypothetical protein